MLARLRRWFERVARLDAALGAGHFIYHWVWPVLAAVIGGGSALLREAPLFIVLLVVLGAAVLALVIVLLCIMINEKLIARRPGPGQGAVPVRKLDLHDGTRRQVGLVLNIFRQAAENLFFVTQAVKVRLGKDGGIPVLTASLIEYPEKSMNESLKKLDISLADVCAETALTQMILANLCKNYADLLRYISLITKELKFDFARTGNITQWEKYDADLAEELKRMIVDPNFSVFSNRVHGLLNAFGIAASQSLRAQARD